MARISLLPIVFLGLIGVAAGSCKATENGPSDVSLNPVSPGQVRVMATVLEIDSTLARRPNDPCSRVPCRATLRIDSLGEYGAAFPRPLSKGERLQVHFAFTLAPTDEVMPEISTSLPGLEVGASFWANLSGQEMLGPGGESARFIVYDYARISGR